jgi:hypothetical protein
LDSLRIPGWTRKLNLSQEYADKDEESRLPPRISPYALTTSATRLTGIETATAYVSG